jgi:hypothetical protein
MNFAIDWVRRRIFDRSAGSGICRCAEDLWPYPRQIIALTVGSSDNHMAEKGGQRLSSSSTYP